MATALMLATFTDQRDFGDEWLLERKFDGERCVARKAGRAVELESRTGNRLTGLYPEVHAAVVAQRARGLVLVYCVFDLLELNDENLTGHRLLERRARLAKAVRPRPALRLSDAWRGDSERRFADACRAGWEGLIVKRADAPYVSGRSRDWLKLKCAWEQELVIGGYTDPSGSRTDFGALLVGYYEDGRLRYAGKVGTGYAAATLRNLGARLRAQKTAESPFVDARPIPCGTHWIRPQLVAQIGFAQWTHDGRLRQPRFLGLRDDKRPTDIVRECALAPADTGRGQLPAVPNRGLGPTP